MRVGGPALADRGGRRLDTGERFRAASAGWAANICPMWRAAGVRSGMSSEPMNEPGQAQLLLIRRYARAMRELQSEAVKARTSRIVARDARRPGAPEPLIEAAKSLAGDSRPPTAPV
jgi:hypothetical protein